MCRLSGNLGDSDSWNPQDLSRPVQGRLFCHVLPFTNVDLEENVIDMVLFVPGSVYIN